MKFEAKLFLYGVLFFIPVGIVYAVWSGGEPVGTYGIPLVGGMAGMIGGYLYLVGKRIDARPEDDPLGEIEQGAGDQGVFSPWSWWPLVLGLAGTVVFLALAVGWWLLLPGLLIGAVGLVGWVFEFSRGQHAH
ncbi:cytochrome c oxidase subunit 4 [Cellulomonas marina]|uniref:Cytochrome c oxidase polypeptide 4 n=1 Tax=Cellulomonas marina TaxID=988821 RepID=A0A1I0W177_9CELL|nr:cytochrome c oxidase subunit 4 [Cellulomonas marina]GIG27428.1 putative cytochrome c oxidase polypeptide 4 [Cellulomonas marina]SFA82010.1 Cytochrome c oxidase subunit IV [Cellulomonas marina]